MDTRNKLDLIREMNERVIAEMREKYGPATVPDGESVQADKDWNQHQSIEKKATVGAYLGLITQYPLCMGGIGPTCTPGRENAARRIREKESFRRMVQRGVPVGH